MMDIKPAQIKALMAEMGRKGGKIGGPVTTRESLCKACGRCELAKAARRRAKKEEVIW